MNALIKKFESAKTDTEVNVVDYTIALCADEHGSPLFKVVGNGNTLWYGSEGLFLNGEEVIIESEEDYIDLLTKVNVSHSIEDGVRVHKNPYFTQYANIEEKTITYSTETRTVAIDFVTGGVTYVACGEIQWSRQIGHDITQMEAFRRVFMNIDDVTPRMPKPTYLG